MRSPTLLAVASNLLALLLGILKTVGQHADIVCEIEIFQGGKQSSLYPPRGAICGPTDRGQNHHEQEQREQTFLSYANCYTESRCGRGRQCHSVVDKTCESLIELLYYTLPELERYQPALDPQKRSLKTSNCIE